jgi:hypothetical protein
MKRILQNGAFGERILGEGNPLYRGEYLNV